MNYPRIVVVIDQHVALSKVEVEGRILPTMSIEIVSDWRKDLTRESFVQLRLPAALCRVIVLPPGGMRAAEYHRAYCEDAPGSATHAPGADGLTCGRFP